MSLATFLDALSVIAGGPASAPVAAAPEAGAPALSAGERGALEEMLRATQPAFMLLVHQEDAAGSQRLQEWMRCMAQAGSAGSQLLVVALDGATPSPQLPAPAADASITYCPAHVTNAELRALLHVHGVRADALVLNPSVPAGALQQWAGNAQTLVQDKGWLFGTHGWGAGMFAALEHAAAAQGLNLAFSANIWVATRTAWALPRLGAPIAGTVEPVRFGSITASVDAVTDRSRFLQCVDQGLSCYQPWDGGQQFANPLPRNIVGQAPEVRADYMHLHFPPFKEIDHTEAHCIANLRDVRVSGVRGYLYSRNNELLEQSFGVGSAGVAAVKAIIPPYEPIIRKAVASSDHIQWQTMAGVFAPSVQLDAPHVVAMWPDTYIYHHWMVGCLTRFWYLEAYPELAGLPIVMNPFIRKYQFEYMAMLGLLDKNRLVFSNDSVSLKLKQAIYPTHIGMAPHSPQAIHWLRHRFLRHAAKVPAGYENGLYYISRKDGRSREISNEAEILAFLQAYGFQVVEWSAFSVAEQIAMAHHAKVIIGAHGSNMSNTVYINPECKVLDIRNTKHNGHDLTISAATEVAGGKFYVTPTFCPPEHGRLRANNALDMSHDNHQINVADFKAVFTQMMDG